MQLSEQEIIRREKLTKLREMGINPYPAALFPVDATSKSIKANYSEGKKVVISGRLMSRRIQGKASFAELQDSAGRIQVYFNRDEICPDEDKTLYNDVYKKLLDIGDIIGIEGELLPPKWEKNGDGQDLLVVEQIVEAPAPSKKDTEGHVFDEFNDPEQRYRQRYVDLVVNPKVKETFIKRTKITNTIREFYNERGYLEVETPILQPIPGGAAARPFLTHHNALNIPLYLRIANELYLKRLIVGGFDGVYEFSKDFRNEGMDRTHNPEFTVMELYVAYKDYNWMMDTTEQLLEKVATEATGSTKVPVGKNEIEFKAPYPRVPILEAIKIHTGFDVVKMDENELRETAKKLHIEVDETMGVGKLIDEIFGEKCEHHYIQPTFITDYPKEMSPLTKEHRDNPALTERFELMANGKEIANAYSELNDPIEQRERFEDQLKLSEKGDDEAMFIDQDFLRALEYGMPPTSGIGIGIDRLVMLMTNNSSIQEVLFFPQMRPEKKAIEMTEEEKLIYDILMQYNDQRDFYLHEVKISSGFSNKKWDSITKSMKAKGIINIRKSNDDILIKVTK